MKTLFFSDLDNTLIYSHRKDAPGDAIWIERLNGNLQSFMTQATYSFFLSQQSFSVIPVTTRSELQYSRLQSMTRELGWHDALICNGAVLMKDGVVDRQWLYDSKQIATCDLCSLFDIYHQLSLRVKPQSMVSLFDLMFYLTRLEDIDNIYAWINENADLEHLFIARDSRKIYVIPKSLHKGAAVQRYLSKVKHTITFAAGDSIFDLPMLSEVDCGFLPKSYTGLIPSNVQVLDSLYYSDAICDKLRILTKRCR